MSLGSRNDEERSEMRLQDLVRNCLFPFAKGGLSSGPEKFDGFYRYRAALNFSFLPSHPARCVACLVARESRRYVHVSGTNRYIQSYRASRKFYDRQSPVAKIRVKSQSPEKNIHNHTKNKPASKLSDVNYSHF